MSLCFNFSTSGSGKESKLRIHRCCEQISYADNRNHVEFFTTLVFELNGDKATCLRASYRGLVDKFSILSSNEWSEDDDPFMNLLYKKQSFHSSSNELLDLYEMSFDDKNSLVLKPYPFKAKMPRDISVTEPIHKAIQAIGRPIPSYHYCPYSVLEIGPFKGKGSVYAIRYKTKINMRTINKTITEDMIGGFRFHEIYNTKDTIDLIRHVDIPRLKLSPIDSPQVYETYNEFFETELRRKKIIPENYSVVIVGAECLERPMQAIELIASEGTVFSVNNKMVQMLTNLEQFNKRDLHMFLAKRGKEGYALKLKSPIPLEERFNTWKSRRIRRR